MVSHTPYRAIVSVPIADQRLGGELAIDLYYRQHQLTLDSRSRRDINAAVAAVTALLAAGSGPADPRVPGPVWLNNEAAHARALVWTAMGMIGVAMELNSRDALAVLRGYAFSHDVTIDDLARSLTNRNLPVEALAG